MNPISLSDLVDYFDPTKYPIDPATGRSEVPYEDIMAALQYFFPNGYSWTVTSQGFKPDGNAYMTIKLEVYNGPFTHTCPGSAENEGNRQIGFAGLQQMALRNAVLRGLRMGEALYQNKQQPQSNINPNINNPLRSNFSRTPAKWDGSKLLGPTSKKYAGQPYSSVKDEDIDKWSNGPSPNPNAVKERQRRIDNGIWTMTAPAATWANPAGDNYF